MAGRRTALAATLLLAACSGSEEPAAAPGRTDEPAAEGSASPAASPAASNVPNQPVAGWDLQSSGEGVALVFPASGGPAVRLFCPADANRLLVNVPGFRPIGSEERLTFGSGGNAHALVADTRGDRRRGGVSGTGAVPGNLAALIGGPVSVSYGAQRSGPHPVPPHGLARAFAAACNERTPAATPTPSPTATSPGPGPKPTQVSACLMQGDQRLTHPPLRAIGTEPFWGAAIEGRCVTYSHPENQQGTRVWTRYSANPGGGGTWTGTLGGRRFVLTTRPQPGCSDGMSDNRYPIAVELLVGGEKRRGCAERR